MRLPLTPSGPSISAPPTAAPTAEAPTVVVDSQVNASVVACAGASDEDHERSLAAMAFYAPQVEVIGSTDL